MEAPSSGPTPIYTKQQVVQLLEDLKEQYQAISRRHQRAVRNELLRAEYYEF